MAEIRNYIIDGAVVSTDRPFRIDGIPIPTPDDYEYGEDDLSSAETGRTLDGEMHKDVVTIKDYYTLSWSQLSWTDASVLLGAARGKTEIDFTHASPLYPGRFVTDRFYAGKRSAKARNLNSPGAEWCDISFQITKI